jgi:hypothetical protein
MNSIAHRKVVRLKGMQLLKLNNPFRRESSAYYIGNATPRGDSDHSFNSLLQNKCILCTVY